MKKIKNRHIVEGIYWGFWFITFALLTFAMFYDEVNNHYGTFDFRVFASVMPLVPIMFVPASIHWCYTMFLKWLRSKNVLSFEWYGVWIVYGYFFNFIMNAFVWLVIVALCSVAHL